MGRERVSEIAHHLFITLPNIAANHITYIFVDTESVIMGSNHEAS